MDGENNNELSIDYDKLGEIIQKGQAQKESAILKSYFEQNGLDEEGVKTAISDYKNKKAAEAQKKVNDVEDIKAKNIELQNTIRDMKLNAAISKVSAELGVVPSAVQYVGKMIDAKEILDDKGEIKADALKTAIEGVIKNIPGLKATVQKGFQIGAEPNKTEPKKQVNNIPVKRWNRFN